MRISPQSRAILTAAAMSIFAAVAYGQKVVQPWDNPCNDEIVKANLYLTAKRHVVGTVKDQSGAPFAHSRVLIQRFPEKDMSTSFKEVLTDNQGKVDFGMVTPGKYRFLPSPTRAFKPPRQVNCGEEEICELDLTLEVNTSDQAFVNCPIQ